jgi:folate-dependent phosphoribosylglycinamide formyltransferase PurN
LLLYSSFSPVILFQTSEIRSFTVEEKTINSYYSADRNIVQIIMNFVINVCYLDFYFSILSRNS